jgi:hypothetical protein
MWRLWVYMRMVLTCIMESCVFICCRSPDFEVDVYPVCAEMEVTSLCAVLIRYHWLVVCPCPCCHNGLWHEVDGGVNLIV